MVTMRDVVRYIHVLGKRDNVYYYPALNGEEIRKAVDLVNLRGKSNTLTKEGMIDNALYDLYLRRVQDEYNCERVEE